MLLVTVSECIPLKCCCPGGRLCSFSPCIEQVQRSCSVIHDNGFTDVTTLECLQRVLDVRSVTVSVADLGYGTANSCCNCDAKSVLGSEPVTGHIETVELVHHQKAKKLKHITDPGDGNNDINCVADDKSDEPVSEISSETHTEVESRNVHKQSRTKSSYHFRSALPVSQMTGHTGFLTFATLYPK